MSARVHFGLCLFVLLLVVGVSVLSGCTVPTGDGVTANEQHPTKPAQVTVAQRLERVCGQLADEVAPKLPAGRAAAVIPWLDAEGGVRRLGVVVAEEITSQLTRRGVKLVDRSRLNEILGEIDLAVAMSGKDATGALTRIREAEVLVVGREIDSGKEVLLSAKVVAVKGRTGGVLAATGQVALSARGLGWLRWYVRRPATDRPGGELPPLAVRYEFVSPVAGGAEIRLIEGSIVRSGQRFKVRLEPNSDCYLYVLLYDSQGRASVLFPHGDIGVPNDARGGVSYAIPEGTKWYWFDDKPGIETFYIVASYTPLNDLDQLLAKMQRAAEQQMQMGSAARDHIDRVVMRGMLPSTSAGYQPKGYAVKTRGVGGVEDIGWGVSSSGSSAEMDNIVSGHATVVKKIMLNHR